MYVRSKCINQDNPWASCEKELMCYNETCKHYYDTRRYHKLKKKVMNEIKKLKVIKYECYECEQCDTKVKTKKDLTITYGCMDMKFCEDCYKTSS